MQKCASFLFSLHHCEISMLGFRTALFLFLFSFVWVFVVVDKTSSILLFQRREYNEKLER